MHVAFLHDTMFWVLFCLTQSLIQHPHWSVCRSDVNTPAPLPLSVFFVWQLNTGLPVRVRLTDCLTSSLVCAMQFWPNVSSLSLSLMSDCLMLFACYSSSGIPLPPFAAALCNQEAVQQCLRVSVSLPLIALSAHLSSHPSIWSQPNYGDAICAKDCLNFPLSLY